MSFPHDLDEAMITLSGRQVLASVLDDRRYAPPPEHLTSSQPLMPGKESIPVLPLTLDNDGLQKPHLVNSLGKLLHLGRLDLGKRLVISLESA